MTRQEIDLRKLRQNMQLPEEAQWLIGELAAKSIFQRFARHDVSLLKDTIRKYWSRVVSGRLRMFVEGSHSEQITLYELQAGESCPLSIGCMLHNTGLPVHVEILEETHLLLIPIQQLQGYTKKYDFFEKYIHSQSHLRLLHIIHQFSSFAFKPVEERLKEYLLKKHWLMGEPDTIEITHTQIAADLGTVREVVSRNLAKLQAEKVVSLARGTIRILDAAALAKHSGREPNLSQIQPGTIRRG